MFRHCLLLSFAFLFACSGDRHSPGQHAGGAGGTGGSHATGGTGGALPADETPPTLELLMPADGTVFDDPEIIIEGVASDETGVDELILTVGGLPVSIPYTPGPEIQFRFPVTLALGENQIQLEAIDGAGNRSHIERTVSWQNTPGRPPIIEVFDSTPPVLPPGGEFTLHWLVKGTRPITLEIHSPAGASTDVSGRSSLSGLAPLSDHEIVLLYARNTVGMDTRELFLGVGEDLQIWPGDATIAPGTRQRLEVRNATGVQWEADGGEIVQTPDSLALEPRYAFQAWEPGTYTLTARTDSPIERTASITIRVVEQEGRARLYKGIGGQGNSSGWRGPSPVLDQDGSLLISGRSGGMARYRPQSDTWFLERESLYDLQMTLDGRLFGISGSTLFLRSPTGAFEPVATGWHPEQHVESLRLGGDGSLLALVRRPSFGHLQELWIVSPVGISSRVDIPRDLPALTATTGADGTLVVAAQEDSQAPVSIFMRRPGEEWTDLGSLPQITDRLYDLLMTGSGRIFVSGRTLMVWDAGIWTESGAGLPPCGGGDFCGVFDLHERHNGTILAVSRLAVHQLGAGGAFEPLGGPSPFLSPPPAGPMHRIAETPGGTLYLAASAGIYRLSPGIDGWRLIGDRGLPPGSEFSDLLIEPNGALVGAGARWVDSRGSYPLFRLQAGASSWEGFGEDFATADSLEWVQHLARDSAGNLYAYVEDRGVFKTEAGTGRAEALPREGLVLDNRNVRDLAVASDGSLYVAHSDRVLRLAPGAQSWKPLSGLPCTNAFLQTPTGGLWAATCVGPMRLVQAASWELVSEGLPQSFSSDFDARGLSWASDGSVLLASGKGTFRLPPGRQRWERIGVGEPSVQADRITSGGGQTWAISGDVIYELATSGSWLPIDAMPPLSLQNMDIFQATPHGTLLLSGAGLVEAAELQP